MDHDITNEILHVKKQQNAVILAHNYQLEEVQQVADYVGDSFFLSKVAASTDHDKIIFCGVKFMAETAKILSPEKVVLLPESDAGCPMAEMVTAESLRELKSRYPGVPVVCYVNSTAEVKAESDVCCTSANAIKIADSLPQEKIIFVPDENLGHYISTKLPHKQIILWKGFCATHAKVKPEDVEKARQAYPEAEVLIHPECVPDVVARADFVGSTSAIIKHAEQSKAKVFIIGTEMGVLVKLKEDHPDKQFFLLHPGLVCPNMKKTRLQSVYNALMQGHHEITVDAQIAQRAKQALDRMLEVE